MSIPLKRKALTPKHVEEVYNLDAGTLANWRTQGKGPEYVKSEGKVLYLIDKIEAWLRRRSVKTV